MINPETEGTFKRWQNMSIDKKIFMGKESLLYAVILLLINTHFHNVSIMCLGLVVINSVISVRLKTVIIRVPAWPRLIWALYKRATWTDFKKMFSDQFNFRFQSAHLREGIRITKKSDMFSTFILVSDCWPALRDLCLISKSHWP